MENFEEDVQRRVRIELIKEETNKRLKVIRETKEIEEQKRQKALAAEASMLIEKKRLEAKAEEERQRLTFEYVALSAEGLKLNDPNSIRYWLFEDKIITKHSMNINNSNRLLAVGGYILVPMEHRRLLLEAITANIEIWTTVNEEGKRVWTENGINSLDKWACGKGFCLSSELVIPENALFIELPEPKSENSNLELKLTEHESAKSEVKAEEESEEFYQQEPPSWELEPGR